MGTVNKNRELTALEARGEAQRLAFAPIAFQAARVLRESGILGCLQESDGPSSRAQIAKSCGLSVYGVRVLLEAGVQIGLLRHEAKDTYSLTKTGYFMLSDEMTRVNMDFVHDVCYRGMMHLGEAIAEGTPAGLKEFGDWDTVYEGLSSLPEQVKKSWFAFDHFYSDAAFPVVLPKIFSQAPEKLLDIGGNTGKFSVQCAKFNPEVQITIVDLPGQLEVAIQTAREAGLSNRITGHPVNLLDPSAPLPTGYDALWMSQFLDCFSEEEILSLLGRARVAMGDHSYLYILETFWDRQKFEMASYCLVNTSLYFTCIANGNSRMYHSEDMKGLVAEAGLELVEQTDDVGLGHTLLKIKKVG